MNKLNPNSPLTYQTSTRPAVSTFPPVTVNTTPGTCHRLIVIVPEDLDCSAASRRILELARATGMQVQLLSLCGDAAEELGFRRRLVTIASLVQDGRTRVDVKVEHGTNWVDAVKKTYETGDVIVCFAEQRTGPLHKPLSQILESNFKATVYILSSFISEKSGRSRFSQVGAWAGFVGIIICFGILQANIIQLQEGWAQNVLLILSTISEFWLIWVWNDGVR